MMIYNEIGMGRYEDKILKNKFVFDKIFGVEDFNIIDLEGNNNGLFYELVLFGVIGVIVFLINLIEIIINNSILMFVFGNIVVFLLYFGVKKVLVYIV